MSPPPEGPRRNNGRGRKPQMWSHQGLSDGGRAGCFAAGPQLAPYAEDSASVTRLEGSGSAWTTARRRVALVTAT